MYLTFQKRYLTPEANAKLVDLAKKFDAFRESVLSDVPAGREASIFTTKLEEAYHIAVQGIGNAPANWRQPPSE